MVPMIHGSVTITLLCARAGEQDWVEQEEQQGHLPWDFTRLLGARLSSLHEVKTARHTQGQDQDSRRQTA